MREMKLIQLHILILISPFLQKGGVTITPSARKSIHSYKVDISENMGRYGLEKNTIGRGNSSPKVDQGVDEVDNVMR